MKEVTRWTGLVLLVVALGLVAGCSSRPGALTPPALSPEAVPTEGPAAETPTPPPPSAAPTVRSTDTPTAVPASEADLDEALAVTEDFLNELSKGQYRSVYGSLLTTPGQERLAELVLGRLALSDPRINFFEVRGAEPLGQRVAVDVVWRESSEAQGEVGTQEARLILARQDDDLLVDDVELGAYQPAATPVPPPLPKSETLTIPALAGQELRFRATGFQAGETVLTWLELPDGGLVSPTFSQAGADGSLDAAYTAESTQDQPAGKWIWWAQALRDSARNTGITFDVQAAAPSPTAVPTRVPTRAPAPAPAEPQATAVAQEPPTAVAQQPAETPQPSGGYPAPAILWPEPETSRNYGSALVVEFVPVAGELGPDEFYELVLVANNLQGGAYAAGSVRGSGDACQGRYSSPCVSMTASERFMDPFFPAGDEGKGTWFVQVVKQTGPEQFTPISSPSESRIVILKPRPS